MEFQEIYLGTLANDGTGDDLRTAFEKIINNFAYLREISEANLNGVNAGGGIEIFESRTGDNFIFRTLESGTNIDLIQDGDKIVAALNIDSQLDLNGQSVNHAGDIYLDPTKRVFGILQGQVYGMIYPENPSASDVIGVGSIVGLNPNVSPSSPFYSPARVDGVSVQDLARSVTNFNFGRLPQNGSTRYNDSMEYLLDHVGLDLGYILNGASISIDAGTLAGTIL